MVTNFNNAVSNRGRIWLFGFLTKGHGFTRIPMFWYICSNRHEHSGLISIPLIQNTCEPFLDKTFLLRLLCMEQSVLLANMTYAFQLSSSLIEITPAKLSLKWSEFIKTARYLCCLYSCMYYNRFSHFYPI